MWINFSVWEVSLLRESCFPHFLLSVYLFIIIQPLFQYCFVQRGWKNPALAAKVHVCTVGTKKNHTCVLWESELRSDRQDWNWVGEMGAEKCVWGWRKELLKGGDLETVQRRVRNLVWLQHGLPIGKCHDRDLEIRLYRKVKGLHFWLGVGGGLVTKSCPALAPHVL